MNTARTMRAWLTTFVAATLTALSVGIIAPAAAAASSCTTTTPCTPITGSGSTWAFPAIHLWDSNMAQFGVTVNYQPNGSRSGRTFFAGGQSDWAASEIPYGVVDGANTDSPPKRGFAYMPDVAGGVGFMYNLSIGRQRVTNLRLSGAVIAGIFTNKITFWDDPQIKADNPQLDLPHLQITPVVRSDGDGATAVFTQWMLATEHSAWQAYCTAVGRTPCTQTSTYPVQGGTAMIGQPGDPGVATYVAQPSSTGAIGFVPYSWALQEGFPVAKVLNAAGYYTAPTPANVGVSLLDAQLNTDGSADLSGVYTDTDPRTYELSYYSYLIVPTDLSDGMTTFKGNTLGIFGQYALCQGQSQVNVLGYSALPINLVEDGFAQLQKIPGANVPATTAAFIAGCNNPTFSPDGTNTLAADDPMPPTCDQQGATQCTGPTGSIVTLTASPDPATADQAVTLAATVMTGASVPTGSVQFFEAGGTDIGPPVTLDASGVATTTTTFAAPGTETVSAVFSPADPGVVTSGVGTLSLTVQKDPLVSTVPLAATVPVFGAFSLTVDTADTVTLAVNGNTATAALTPVTVSDTRNSYPGWSVAGQVDDFVGTGAAAGSSISGDQLGWTPTGSSLAPGVTLGAAVVPAAPGLGNAPGFLASAHSGIGSGYGTSTFGADLTLVIPAEAAAGSYTGALNVTAVTDLP